MFRARPVVALFVFVAAPGMLRAQGQPLGPEFQVNTYTTFDQREASVASDSAGNLVVAWTSAQQDGSATGVFAQRYASTGTPLGGEFRVNTLTTSFQGQPSVASDSNGNFVIAWTSGQQVFAQRYASTGAPLDGEFQVSVSAQFPSVAMDTAGNFVVAWRSNQDGSSYGIFAQRYAGTGVPLGAQFRVNTYTTGTQSSPSVVSDSAGNFVVVWQGNSQDGGSYGVFAQRYASDGSPLGGEFRVNSYTTFYQRSPSVASDSAGNFVVAWHSATQDGNGSGVFAQRYASTGTPLGGEFRVNTFTLGYQVAPSVASDSGGNFVVAWQSYNQDGSGPGVFAQRYANTGAPLGGEFRVNSHTTGYQRAASVAADSAGDFVVAWESYNQDGDDFGVFAQRYGMIVPVELQSFRVD